MQHSTETTAHGSDIQELPETLSGLRIAVDGTIDTVELTRDEPGGSALPALYTAIGCAWVDVVRLTDELDMWVDDEGMFTAEVNTVATAVAHHFQQHIPPHWRQNYHGTVVLLEANQDTGATRSLTGVRGLTGEQLAALQEAAATL